MYKRISKTAYNQTFNPEPLGKCWKECLEKSSFHARKQDAEEFNKKNYWKKRGLAVVPHEIYHWSPHKLLHSGEVGRHVIPPKALLYMTSYLKIVIVSD